jgi:uncharacterized protein (TIGR02284 family)
MPAIAFHHRRFAMSNDHDISVLNDLVTTTIDSADGFERAAEDASAPRFVDMFRDFASERRQCVSTLQAAVRACGGTPNDDGSMAAGLHRRWLDLRDAISGGDDAAIIAEVERGEDHIKSKYEEAIADTDLSPATLSAIRSAYESVRAGHDRASALKHSMQAARA